MTCIVALRSKQGMHIFGDTQGSNSFTHGVYETSKVGVKYVDDIIFKYGVTGSYRTINILEGKLTLPHQNGLSEDEYVFNLVENIRKIHDTYGAKETSNGVDIFPSNVIFTIFDRMFTLQGDFAYLEHSREIGAFATAGIGDTFASGYLASKKTPTKDDCVNAIKRAHEFVPGVGTIVTEV